MAPKKKKSPGTKDLKLRTLKSSKAASVRGGTMRDFMIIKKIDKASAVL